VKIPLSDTLRRLDRHWLLNHPVLWMMRLHWRIYLWLFGLGLSCIAALVVPVSFQTVRFLNPYFWCACALTWLALIRWSFLQLNFTSELRQNSQSRTAAYLLGGYLIVFSIHLAGPYAFIAIVEGRISNRISESELRRDFRAFTTIHADLIHNLSWMRGPQELTRLPPKIQESFHAFQRLSSKYQLPYSDVNLMTLREREDFFFIAEDDLIHMMRSLYFLKVVDPISDAKEMDPILFSRAGNPVFNRVQWLLKDPRNYNNWTALVILGSIVLLQALSLQICQVTKAEGLQILLFSGISFLPPLISAYGFLRPHGEGIVSSKVTVVSSAILFLLFLIGGYIAVLVPWLRRNNFWFATGISVFNLMLAWVPLLLRLFSKPAGYTFVWERSGAGGRLEASLFLLGIVLLFVLTPWIQRRYIALQAKPS
jgi:hypothetical protein